MVPARSRFSPGRAVPRREQTERKGPNVDRALRGVPDIAAWRNPTLWLFTVDVALVVWGTAGYLSGSLPVGVTGHQGNAPRERTGAGLQRVRGRAPTD